MHTITVFRTYDTTGYRPGRAASPDTGMSGIGNSLLLDELARRGYQTVDTDYDGYTVRVAGEWL